MNDRQVVDAWARAEGYADFSTYIATGGSLADAMVKVNEQIAKLRGIQQVMAVWRAGDYSPLSAAPPHVASPDCWCGPVPDPEEPSVLVHREGAEG